MTRPIWTRLLVASLVLLADGAYAAKTGVSPEAAAVACVSTPWTAQTGIPATPESKWQPALASTNAFTTASRAHQHPTQAYSKPALAKLQYITYSPRAPPNPVNS